MKLKKIDDLKTPLLTVWDKCEYNNVYFKNNINLLTQKGNVIQTFDTATNDMLIHTIKNYENIDVLLLINKSPTESLRYFDEHLKDNYTKLAIKNDEYNKNMLLKILYQLYYERNSITGYRHFTDFIFRKFNYLKDKSDEELIHFTLFIVIKRNSKYNQISIEEDDHYLYAPMNNNEKDILSTIFLNKNTIDLMKIQDLEFFFIHGIDEFKHKFNIYRNFVNEQLNREDQSQMLLFSSIILNIIGHRKANDIDFLAFNLSEESKNNLLDFRERHINDFRNDTDELEISEAQENDDNTESFTINSTNGNKRSTKKDPNRCMDIFIKNTEHWPHYWSVWLDDWSRKSGAKYFKEVLANGDYHCYFLGMKLTTLKMDIERRLSRERPRAYADIYALKRRYNLKDFGIIDLDLVINDKKEKCFQLKDISEEEKNRILSEKGGRIRENIREIYYYEEQNISKFVQTMMWFLLKIYRMKDLKIEDLKKDLIIPSLMKKNIILERKKENYIRNLSLGSILRLDDIRQEQKNLEEFVIEDNNKNKKSYDISNTNNTDSNEKELDDFIIEDSNKPEKEDYQKETKVKKIIRKKQNVMNTIEENVIENKTIENDVLSLSEKNNDVQIVKKKIIRKKKE